MAGTGAGVLALGRAPPRACRGRGWSVERACDSDLTLWASLNNADLLLWPSRLLWGAFLTPIPSGHFCTANSCPLPRPTLLTPSSGTQPCQHWWTPPQAWARRAMSWTVCVSLTLSCLSWLLHFPPIAPEAPLLSQLISLPVRGPPRCYNLFSFSVPQQGWESYPISSFLFLPFLLLVIPNYTRIFTCPGRCLRSSASVS